MLKIKISMIVPDNLFRNMLHVLTQQTPPRSKKYSQHPITHNSSKNQCHHCGLRTTTTKHWGKVDRAARHELVRDGFVDTEDLSFQNIDAVQAEHFPHRTVCNIQRNIKDFSGAFDLEEGLIRARQGNTCLLFYSLICLCARLTSSRICCPRHCPYRRLHPCR